MTGLTPAEFRSTAATLRRAAQQFGFPNPDKAEFTAELLDSEADHLEANP